LGRLKRAAVGFIPEVLIITSTQSETPLYQRADWQDSNGFCLEKYAFNNGQIITPSL
jgi:hypothetical protein